MAPRSKPVDKAEKSQARDMYAVQGLSFRSIGTKLGRDHKTISNWYDKTLGKADDWEAYKALIKKQKLSASQGQHISILNGPQSPQNPQNPQENKDPQMSSDEIYGDLVAAQREDMIFKTRSYSEKVTQFQNMVLKDLEEQRQILVTIHKQLRAEWEPKKKPVTRNGETVIEDVVSADFDTLKSIRISADILTLTSKLIKGLHDQMRPAENPDADDLDPLKADMPNDFEGYVEKSVNLRKQHHPNVRASDALTDSIRELEAQALEAKQEPERDFGEEDVPVVDEDADDRAEANAAAAADEDDGEVPGVKDEAEYLDPDDEAFLLAGVETDEEQEDQEEDEWADEDEEDDDDF